MCKAVRRAFSAQIGKGRQAERANWQPQQINYPEETISVIHSFQYRGSHGRTRRALDERGTQEARA